MNFLCDFTDHVLSALTPYSRLLSTPTYLVQRWSWLTSSNTFFRVPVCLGKFNSNLSCRHPSLTTSPFLNLSYLSPLMVVVSHFHLCYQFGSQHISVSNNRGRKRIPKIKMLFSQKLGVLLFSILCKSFPDFLSFILLCYFLLSFFPPSLSLLLLPFLFCVLWYFTSYDLHHFWHKIIKWDISQHGRQPSISLQ